MLFVVLGTAYQVCDDWQTVSRRFFWRDNSPQRFSHAMLSYHRHSCSDRHHLYTRRLRYVWGRGGGVGCAKLRLLPGKLNNLCSIRCYFLYPWSICNDKVTTASSGRGYNYQLNGGGGESSSSLRPPLNPFRSRFAFFK